MQEGLDAIREVSKRLRRLRTVEIPLLLLLLLLLLLFFPNEAMFMTHGTSQLALKNLKEP